MNNLILFVNTFLSYLLVMAVIFVVAAAAFFIGLKLRKAKDLKSASADSTDVSGEQNDNHVLDK